MKGQTKMKLVIPFHSFVDFITNSSTEVFVEATDKTVQAVHAVVNELLKSHTDDKSEDIFDVQLGMLYQKWDEVKKKDVETFVLKGSDDYDQAEEYQAAEISIKVKKHHAKYKAAATALEKLTKTMVSSEKMC